MRGACGEKGGQAHSVRRESCNSDSSPEPSAAGSESGLLEAAEGEVVEVEFADAAVLGGLDEEAGFDDEGGEPAAGPCAGVDAGGVAEVFGDAGALGGVADDEGFAGEVRFGVFGEELPEEPVGRLVSEGDVGCGVGVGEAMGVGFEGIEERVFEEVPVVWGDVGETREP